MQPIVARAPVLYPARVPVRAFPELRVSGGVLPEGDLVALLVAHLAADERYDVQRVAVEQLEPLREEGALSPLTLVLLVEPALYSDVRQDWDVVPVQVCDFYWGCFIDYQSVHVDTPALVAEVRLTVYEGPTARVLQTELFEAVNFGSDTAAARGRLLGDLGKQLERAVDVLKSSQRVELVPVRDFAEVERALALLKRGEWQAGRELLERAATQLGGRSRSVQARVWYNLGIARWHSSPDGELPQATFESAQRALSLAVSLEPRFRRALSALERARSRQRVLDEQRSATARNRALYEAQRAETSGLETAPAPAPAPTTAPSKK
jgi:hypothetical protein